MNGVHVEANFVFIKDRVSCSCEGKSKTCYNFSDEANYNYFFSILTIEELSGDPGAFRPPLLSGSSLKIGECYVHHRPPVHVLLCVTSHY